MVYSSITEHLVSIRELLRPITTTIIIIIIANHILFHSSPSIYSGFVYPISSSLALFQHGAASCPLQEVGVYMRSGTAQAGWSWRGQPCTLSPSSKWRQGQETLRASIVESCMVTVPYMAATPMPSSTITNHHQKKHSHFPRPLHSCLERLKRESFYSTLCLGPFASCPSGWDL